MAGRRNRLIAGASLALAGAAAAYALLARESCVTWGARSEEANREMPGDQLLPDPETMTARAVTINAPPSATWPWLVQMGRGR